MELKPDCVRDVLLAVERMSIDKVYAFGDFCKILPKWYDNDIQYTCLKLAEKDLLDILSARYAHDALPTVIEVRGLTYKGHEFLDTIKNDKAWRKVKKKLEKVQDVSIEAIVEAAFGAAKCVLLACIKERFGI